MTLLLYCICEAQAEVTPPAAGVREAAVQAIVQDGLRCFYSEVSDFGGDATMPTSAKGGQMWGTLEVQKDAVEFHRVTHTIFHRSAIIPFRFPTLLKDMAEVTALIAARASEYTAALKRVGDAVQMEVRISLAGQAAEAASGAEYLRTRADISRKLEQAASGGKAAAQEHTLEWRQRRSRDGVRCFALIRRSEVYNFEQAFRALPVDAALKVIVSGPWPATEFLELPTHNCGLHD